VVSKLTSDAKRISVADLAKEEKKRQGRDHLILNMP